MAKDTKSRLLESALEMFSQNGYAGTNIRELSASLGLGKSSLYRHFESKDEIWNAMIDEMERYDESVYHHKKSSAYARCDLRCIGTNLRYSGG